MKNKSKSIAQFTRENIEAIKAKARWLRTSYIKKTDFYSQDLEQIKKTRDYNQTIALTLVGASRISDITTHHGIASNKFFLFEAYFILCQNNALKPLLELAMLAAKGIHDLSGNDQNKKLTIIFDPNSEAVDNLTGEAGAHGVYFETDSNVYIGGKRNLSNKVMSTFMHELTHFLTYEIYKNNCNPYFANSEAPKKAFNKIQNALSGKKDIDPVLKGIFKYPSDQRQGELIARTAELIADGKTAELRKNYPELLDYYEKVFLSDCKNHILKIQARTPNPIQSVINEELINDDNVANDNRPALKAS